MTTVDDEDVTKLVSAFEHNAIRADHAMELMHDVATQHRSVKAMNAIADKLDKIPPGRMALVKLLDSTNPGVRAYAAAYLIEVAPERALPVLRQVNENERGMMAGFTAFTVLFKYAVEHGTPLP